MTVEDVGGGEALATSQELKGERCRRRPFRKTPSGKTLQKSESARDGGRGEARKNGLVSDHGQRLGGICQEKLG